MEIRDLMDKGLSVSEISRRVGHDRKTVRAAIRRGCKALARKRRGGVRRDVKLEPHKEYVQSRMRDGVYNAAVLLEELKARGYCGGITVLRRYVHPYRPRFMTRATVRFETDPGEQAQVDFVDIPFMLPGPTRIWLRLFNYELGYSRFAYMEFMESEQRTSWLRGLDHAFRATGGVPKVVLSDNASALVIGRDEHGQAVFAPEYLAFAQHYGFTARACRPGRAQTKGKVERQGGYVQDNFLARMAGNIVAPIDLMMLNMKLEQWLSHTANARVHGTTHERPCDRLIDEALLLSALPGAAFGLDEVQLRRVSRDGHVQWKTCLYPVPWELCGREVYVHETPEYEIRVEFAGQYVASYPRAAGRYVRLRNPDFRVGLLEASTTGRRVMLMHEAPVVDMWSPEIYEQFAAAQVR